MRCVHVFIYTVSPTCMCVYTYVCAHYAQSQISREWSILGQSSSHLWSASSTEEWQQDSLPLSAFHWPKCPCCIFKTPCIEWRCVLAEQALLGINKSLQMEYCIAKYKKGAWDEITGKLPTYLCTYIRTSYRVDMDVHWCEHCFSCKVASIASISELCGKRLKLVA